jgi:hypothetical protein
MLVLTILIGFLTLFFIGIAILFSSMIHPEEELDSVKAWKDLNAKESSISK